MAKHPANGPDDGSTPGLAEKPKCGIVMPISLIDGLGKAHWADVYSIISDAAESAGFDARLVSRANDVGIIQKRIVQNLYDDPIVVCDVSAKNPNVMFELGMRLAFDKPTIIIKDDQTSYVFDTGQIEHLEYPRDLRFTRILDFKEKLRNKIEATHKRAMDDPTYTTFLKHFGEFKVASIEKKEVSGQEYILKKLKEIKSTLRAYRQPVLQNYVNALQDYRNTYNRILEIMCDEPSERQMGYVITRLSSLGISVNNHTFTKDHRCIIDVDAPITLNTQQLSQKVTEMACPLRSGRP